MGKVKASSIKATAETEPIYNPHTGEQDKKKKNNGADDEESDNHSMSSGTSGKSKSTGSNNKTSNYGWGNEGIAASLLLGLWETRLVNCSKLCLLIVLSLCAVSCAVTTYVYVKNNETNGFQQQYKDYTEEIIDIVHFQSSNIYNTVAAFGTTIMSYAIDRNATWPYVQIPHYEIRGEDNDAISKALLIGISPLVTKENKASYLNYTYNHQEWIQEGLDVQCFSQGKECVSQEQNITTYLTRLSDGNVGTTVPQNEPGANFGPGQYAPVWQFAPVAANPSIAGYDTLSHPTFHRVYYGMWETQKPVMSEVVDLEFLYKGAIEEESNRPKSFLLHPLYPYFEDKDTSFQRDDLVGFVMAILPWDVYFANILPAGVSGIHLVLHDTCDNDHTFELRGADAIYLGKGDLHEPKYDELLVEAEFAPFLDYNFSDTHDHCEYTIRIYPSQSFEDEFHTMSPVWYTLLILVVFGFTAMCFLLYDYVVQVRQRKVTATAQRTHAIVSSMFPAVVRDRILKDAEEQVENELRNTQKNKRASAAKSQLKSFLDDDGNGMKNANGIGVYDTKPIADLFPATTIMFADIVGFTAWSSVREPTQVFTLLETIYHAFDEIARHRRVFKVETVGDCYVAVTGLPEARKDHAVAMARFARDILDKMNQLTKKLEISLGPDTGDLSLRIGMHSGPVTAGVLRGDKSRFQLFGDSMNTTARIETTGAPNKIHMSKETAELLKQDRKSHWVVPREESVEAKGKGRLQTFWLDLRQETHDSSSGASTTSNTSDEKNTDLTGAPQEIGFKSGGGLSEKTQRLINWNTDVLARLLCQIIGRRRGIAINNEESSQFRKRFEEPVFHENGNTVLDEVAEIIHLPAFEGTAQVDDKAVNLGDDVKSQLQEYITIIATLYRDNPFHNFEHASHVSMSVVKLLSRIVAPDVLDNIVMEGESNEVDEQKMASTLHDHTYGITSDPLTQFACVFSAIIHDADHPGVPNVQLVKENPALAAVYRDRSVAEQNSVDLSWEILMDNKFAGLRAAIYTDEDEFKRFRQLVVNSVMATDIMDAEMKKLRNARWERAFQENADVEESRDDAVNRKATIVIEHLIQASDVAHTMQHWHVYRKWNERLFTEMYYAYRAGRAETDPSTFWYKGEIGFLDFYIIPLAKKLKDCGVFGVSSDEYLNYATTNRQEWEEKGAAVVAAMVEKCKQEYSDASVTTMKSKKSIISTNPTLPKVLNLKTQDDGSGKDVGYKPSVPPLKEEAETKHDDGEKSSNEPAGIKTRGGSLNHEKKHASIKTSKSKKSSDDMGTGRELGEMKMSDSNKSTRSGKNEDDMIAI